MTTARRATRYLRVGLLLLTGLAAGQARPEEPAAQADSAVTRGAQLFREGLRADRSPVEAQRGNGVAVQGQEAACIQCHRASGMGGAEGSTAVPPIVGSILFAPGRPVQPRQPRVFSHLTRQAPAAQIRPAYSLETLLRALNRGIGPTGQSMDALMPRYQLTEAEVRDLAAYTTTLRIGEAPGHDGRTLHLATIETADNTPAVRQAATDLLVQCMAERSPPAQDSPHAPPAWTLHRWQLGADPARWPTELEALQRQQPVFALVSGITGPTGRGAWQAIQQHCERDALPCVLPNTASVDDSQPSVWSFHFSRGVSLDAATMAEVLVEHAPPGGWRQIHLVVEPRHEGAALGARRLVERLGTRPVVRRPEWWVHAPDAPDTAAWLSGLGKHDALALWLPGMALSAWTTRHEPPPGAPRVLASGELIDLDAGAVAPSWRAAVQLTWPYAPIERHLPRVAQNVGQWLQSHQRALASDPALIRLQGHTYSACEVTANALRRMGARVSRAYLAELLEGAEEAATATAYPRFTLGPGRRHGSQGTWLMRFTDPRHARLQPEGDWFVPE